MQCHGAALLSGRPQERRQTRQRGRDSPVDAPTRQRVPKMRRYMFELSNFHSEKNKSPHSERNRMNDNHIQIFKIKLASEAETRRLMHRLAKEYRKCAGPLFELSNFPRVFKFSKSQNSKIPKDRGWTIISPYSNIKTFKLANEADSLPRSTANAQVRIQNLNLQTTMQSHHTCVSSLNSRRLLHV